MGGGASSVRRRQGDGLSEVPAAPGPAEANAALVGDDSLEATLGLEASQMVEEHGCVSTSSPGSPPHAVEPIQFRAGPTAKATTATTRRTARTTTPEEKNPKISGSTKKLLAVFFKDLGEVRPNRTQNQYRRHILL